MTFIEPNIHPILVHFAVGLLSTASAMLILSAFMPASNSWQVKLQNAGDLVLGLGVLAAVLTVSAGFVAYFTVAHDEPSHAAMTVHRNWAVGTAAGFIAMGLWRWKRRSASPSAIFAILLLVATCLLTTTAWWGGRLVYHYGLGVSSLPVAGNAGHGHHQNPGQPHTEHIEPTQQDSPQALGHGNDDPSEQEDNDDNHSH